jgi:RecJ-like exonuclease
MSEITLDMPCVACNGDGYIVVDDATWERYQTWLKDPTEDKVKTPDTFPELLKSLNNFVGVTFGKDVCVPCPKCGGTGTVTKNMTLADLKNLLK